MGLFEGSNSLIREKLNIDDIRNRKFLPKKITHIETSLISNGGDGYFGGDGVVLGGGQFYLIL